MDLKKSPTTSAFSSASLTDTPLSDRMCTSRLTMGPSAGAGTSVASPSAMRLSRSAVVGERFVSSSERMSCGGTWEGEHMHYRRARALQASTCTACEHVDRTPARPQACSSRRAEVRGSWTRLRLPQRSAASPRLPDLPPSLAARLQTIPTPAPPLRSPGWPRGPSARLALS